MLVIGAGPIGQAAILAASDRGARVMAVDRLDNRLALARATGAELTLNTALQELGPLVEEWSEGEGPTVVIEATGVPVLIQEAVRLVAPSGTVVIVGISPDEVSIPIPTFTRKEINLLGSRNNAGLFGSAVDLVQRNSNRVANLITHRFPFSRAPEAMEFATTRQFEAQKVLVMMGDGG